jgi:hypothetical protein
VDLLWTWNWLAWATLKNIAVIVDVGLFQQNHLPSLNLVLGLKMIEMVAPGKIGSANFLFAEPGGAMDPIKKLKS